jgi:hypothetical protein
MESHSYKKTRPYVGGKQVAFQAYVGMKLKDHLASFGTDGVNDLALEEM